MRSITLALVVAFATATRLTAIDASLAKDTDVKPIDIKDNKIDIKDKKLEKPLEIKPPGELKKEETLENTNEEGSKNCGV